MKNQGKMAIFFGINIFINEKYQLNGPVAITKNSFYIYLHLIVNLVMANISVILVCFDFSPLVTLLVTLLVT